MTDHAKIGMDRCWVIVIAGGFLPATDKVASTVAFTIVSSRIDYCNVSFTGTTRLNICHLQKAWNTFITSTNSNQRSRSCTGEQPTRWQHMPSRFNQLDNQVTWRHSSCARLKLWPSFVVRGTASRSDTSLGDKAFSYTAPSIWNSFTTVNRAMQNSIDFQSLNPTSYNFES